MVGHDFVNHEASRLGLGALMGKRLVRCRHTGIENSAAHVPPKSSTDILSDECHVRWSKSISTDIFIERLRAGR